MKVKIPLYVGMAAIAIIGILLIVITNNPQNDFQRIVNTVGTTLLAASIVSVILEVSSIKSMVNSSIKAMFEGDISLDGFSNDSLNKLNNKIAAKRSSVQIEGENMGSTIYACEPKLLDLLGGTYYSRHLCKTYLTMDPENGVINKKLVMDYEIVNNYENTNWVEHEFLVYNPKGGETDEVWKNNFSINKFIINETDLTNKAQDYLEIKPIPRKEHKYYETQISFKKELQKCKKHRIQLEFVYTIPITDKIQAFKVNKPAKSVEHTYVIVGPDKYNLTANAFTSFYCNENDEYKVEVLTDTDVKIRFNNWTLPGAGYVITIKES